MEVLARHLLLLLVTHDWALPLRRRAHLYLEVFGNALVQVRDKWRAFVPGSSYVCVCVCVCVILGLPCSSTSVI